MACFVLRGDWVVERAITFIHRRPTSQKRYQRHQPQKKDKKKPAYAGSNTTPEEKLSTE